jgi:oxygen-dependent protoporphyrinogen oxidase
MVVSIMKDYLIIGAGLSGLTTAYYLKQAGFSVQLVEAQPQVGGRIQTVNTGDWQVDIGANTALLSSQPLDNLIDALGIRDQVLVANDAAKKRFVVRGNKLWALPTSIGSFLSTPIVSPMAKLGLLLEPFRGRATREESIADFVARRLGKEWRDWVLDPFISGIFAGNPERISAQAAFHRIWLLEKDYGSLFKGMMARMKGRKAARAAGQYVPSNGMISFKSGMSTLTHALAQTMRDDIATDTRIAQFTALDQGGWQAQTSEGQRYAGKKVIVTLDAPDAAKLLQDVSPTAAKLLASIESPPLAVVALGFDASQITHPLDGFGCLIPRSLGIQTLGAIFSSQIFAGRAPDGKILLSCFLGGSRNPSVANWSEEKIAQQVVKDLTPLLGITGQPEFSKVQLWSHAIAQYHLGHFDKVEQIRHALSADYPNIITRANWHEGISIPDVVANAARFARQQQIISQVGL